MTHIERTRAVVEAGETHDGRIIPAERAELPRPVRVRSGGTVLGSVYGETVELDGDATVEGSIMASDAIDVDGGRVDGEVGTPGKVTGDDGRIDGTVTGTRVRLTECVVRGNVVGDEVILEDCTVLGIVAADRRLELDGTLCYTFRANGDTTLENVTLVLPQAIADGETGFETPVRVAGLGELTIDGDSESSEDGERLPEMTGRDLYGRDGTTYLTLAPRILNLEEVTDRLDTLESNVMDVLDATDEQRGVEEFLSAIGGDATD